MIRLSYTCSLHSEIVHRRKILAKTALGASKQEAERTRSILYSYDMAGTKVVA